MPVRWAMQDFYWATGLSSRNCRALQAYQVFIVAVVLQSAGMKQWMVLACAVDAERIRAVTIISLFMAIALVSEITV